jgi:hypothetical protein
MGAWRARYSVEAGVQSVCGVRRFEASHPSDKNKYVARVGHPDLFSELENSAVGFVAVDYEFGVGSAAEFF